MKKQSICFFLVFFCFLPIFCAYSQSNNSSVDILIRGGTIVTMDKDKKVYEQGLIAIQNGTIVVVQENNATINKFKAKKIIDATGKIIMPGLINTHTHTTMVIFRGIADDLPLQTWLNDHIFPLEAKYVTADSVRKGTLLAIAEMIQSGTTTFSDMYYFEDEVAKAAKEAGIRAVVGETLLDFPTPNKKTVKEGLEYSEMLIKKYSNDPLITISVAPHAPYTCSSDLLKAAKDLADKYNVPLQIHLSETKNEVEDMQNKYGVTPVKYLDSLGILDNKVIAAHCVHLTDEDIQILQQRNVGVAHNPQSNMQLGSGIAPIPELIKAGIKVGLGTDGAASNNDLNMFEEMDMAAKLQKVSHEDPTAISAFDILETATIGGAKVLGLDDQIGSIEKGKKADIIIIDTNKPHIVPLYNVYSQIVYAIDGADVETVIINGKLIMDKHKILTLNVEKIMEDIRKLATQIKQENK